jgi:hypothetical protein
MLLRTNGTFANGKLKSYNLDLKLSSSTIDRLTSKYEVDLRVSVISLLLISLRYICDTEIHQTVHNLNIVRYLYGGS